MEQRKEKTRIKQQNTKRLADWKEESKQKMWTNRTYFTDQLN